MANRRSLAVLLLSLVCLVIGSSSASAASCGDAPFTPVAQVLAFAGDGQSTTVSTAFGTALSARVLGPCGELLSGLTVTFTAPLSGASATFPNGASAVTNAQGLVTVNVNANGTAGSYQVTATAAGIPGVFSLTNTGGAPVPSSVTATAGTPQSTTVNTAFATNLTVIVKDGSNNPVSGVTVTFAAPISGASATLTTLPGARAQSVGKRRSATTGGAGTSVVTGMGGTASIIATANTIAGAYNVSAAVDGLDTAQLSLTNLAGAVSTVTATTGTRQSTAVTTAFNANLTVTVMDSFSNPVIGALVTFAAPTTGASATLTGLGRGSHTQSMGGRPAQANQPAGTTIATDTNGVAVVQATANQITGTYNVSATVDGATPVGYSLTNTAGPAFIVTAIAGTPQSTTVNTAFDTRLQVMVKDSFSNSVPGALVTFAAPTSGPSAVLNGPVGAQSQLLGRKGAQGDPLPGTSVLTGSDGTASVSATANVAAGVYSVTATVNSVTPPSFSLTNVAGAPTSVVMIAGAEQSTLVNTLFRTRLRVLVRDTFNNLVSGATVTFAPPTSGASATLVPILSDTQPQSINGRVADNIVVGLPVVTASNGTAAVFATANTIAGAYSVAARVQGVTTPPTFFLTNLAGPATTVTATGGASQSTAVNTAFATVLQLKVTDSFSNPVSSAMVSFAAPTSGASATISGNVGAVQPNLTKRAQGQAPPGTFFTDGNGNVSVRATANNVAGAYTATATVNGLTPVSFALTNRAGSPANVVVVSGSGQTAAVNTAFPNPLQARLTDTNGNVISGATLLFSGSGVSFGSSNAVTDSSGLVSMTVTAGNSAGISFVTAGLSGAAPAVFTLTTVAGGPASISSGGSGQIAKIGTAFGQPFRVLVQDAVGNPVSSAVVTFAAPSTGASGTFAGSPSVTVDGSGSAISPVFTANKIAGSYTVIATVNGTQLSASFVVTNQGAPGALTAISPATTAPVAGSSVTVQAKVTDAAGLVLSGVAVSFTSGGNSVAPDSVTNSSGIASATFAAGTKAVPTTVTASAVGITQQLVYTMNIVAGPAAQVKFLTPSGSSATASGSFPVQLLVTDQYGNPITGATASFVIQAGGGSVTSASATTNASGSAFVSWILGPTAGSNMLQGSIPGMPGAFLQVTAISTPTLLPKLVVLPNSLAMNAVQGGDNPASINLVVSNTGTGSVSGSQSLTWTVQPGAASWIVPSQSTGSTPSSVTLSFNTSGLTPGIIAGQITFVAGEQTQTVNVQLNLAAIQDAGISAQPRLLYYVAKSGTPLAAPGNTKSLTIDNTGTGTLTWTATSSTPWVTVSPSSGTAPSQVVVTVNSVGLPAGSNSGTITFQSTSASRVMTSQVGVLLQVNPEQPQLVIAPRLLTFSGPVGGGALASQPLQISTDFPVAATYVAGDSATPSWLSLTPSTGAVPATLTAAVNPATLRAGVTTSSAPIALSIGVFDRVEVMVSLAASTDRPSLLLTDGNALTGGMLLVAQAGGSVVTKDFFVKSNNGAPFSWSAISSGGSWLSVSPGSGSGTRAITVSANPSALQPGVYQGQVAIASPDTVQAAQLIGVTLLVTPSQQMSTAAVKVAGSAPVVNQGYLVALSPAGQFTGNVSNPIGLRAEMLDTLGNPISGSTVSVSINGAGNPIVLRETGAGVYEGVWTPLASGDVALTFSSGVFNTDFRSGIINPSATPLPVLFRKGAVNSASFRTDTPLVPGSLGTVFGSALANCAGGTTPCEASATATPLPLNLLTTSLKINNIPTPLLYSGTGQINFQVPLELAGQTSALIQVTSAGQVALLGDVSLAPIAPGVFSVGGSTQGAVIHQSGVLADVNAPAAAGEILSIFATGLGAVTNPPATGAPVVDASSPTTVLPVVTIGGQPAVVGFSGLAPAYVGLYQINVTVPAGVTGDSVSLSVSIGGVAANGVTIAVR